MKVLLSLLTVLLVCINCTGGNVPSNTDAVRQSNVKEAQPPANTSVAQAHDERNLSPPGEAAALRVYVDPETGEFTSPPEGQGPAAKMLAPTATFSTSHEGLQETPSRVRGGGTMVDLKGRFRTPVTATIDSDGEMRIEQGGIDQKE